MPRSQGGPTGISGAGFLPRPLAVLPAAASDAAPLNPGRPALRPSTRRRSRIQPGRGSCRLAPTLLGPGPASDRGRQRRAPRRSSPHASLHPRPHSRPARSRLSRARSSSALRGRGPRRLRAPVPRPRSPGPCGLCPAGARRAPGEMRLRNGTFLTLLLFCLCAFLSLSWYAALSGQKGEPPPHRRPLRPAPGTPEPLRSSPHLFAFGITKFPGQAWPKGASGYQIPVSVWRSGLASACGYPMPGAGAPTGKLRTYGVPTEGQKHKVTEVVVTMCTQRT